MRLVSLLLLTIIIMTGCLKDRSYPVKDAGLPNTGTRHLIHYWNFNNGSNLHNPTYTIGGGNWTYDSTKGGYYDVVSDSTTLNARNGDYGGTALRLRNPAGSFVLSLPTIAHENIVLSFAALHTSNGAKANVLSYSTDGINFTTDSLTPYVNFLDLTWNVYSYDFSNIKNVNNNPDFKIKIDFAIGNINLSGNDRFDNITVDADSIPGYVPPPIVLMHYWNFNDASLTTPTTTIGGGDINFDFATAGGVTGYYDALSPSVTTLNARNGDPAGNALRVRNPCYDMIIQAPTTNYKNIQIKYAVAKSNSGASTDSVFYSIDGINFINAGIATPAYAPGIDPAYTLMSYNLSLIPTVNNNPNFKFKIGFSNGNLGASGNNRFDNLTVEGIHL